MLLTFTSENRMQKLCCADLKSVDELKVRSAQEVESFSPSQNVSSEMTLVPENREIRGF